MSGLFYFVPPENADACNRELVALYKTQTMINSYPYADNYVRALINVARKRNQLLVTKCECLKANYRYRINPQYLRHPFFERYWKPMDEWRAKQRGMPKN